MPIDRYVTPPEVMETMLGRLERAGDHLHSALLNYDRAIPALSYGARLQWEQALHANRLEAARCERQYDEHLASIEGELETP